MREALGITLAQLSEMTGYSVSTINLLEVKGEGSKRLRDKLLSVLLTGKEEGDAAQVAYWQARAKNAEQKLEMLKAALQGIFKKL